MKNCLFNIVLIYMHREVKRSTFGTSFKHFSHIPSQGHQYGLYVNLGSSSEQTSWNIIKRKFLHKPQLILFYLSLSTECDISQDPKMFFTESQWGGSKICFLIFLWTQRLTFPSNCFFSLIWMKCQTERSKQFTNVYQTVHLHLQRLLSTIPVKGCFRRHLSRDHLHVCPGDTDSIAYILWETIYFQKELSTNKQETQWILTYHKFSEITVAFRITRCLIILA